ncbi:hypothetical protein [Bacillus sp. 1P06AnD]|uniref:hypothetical protein n=1 Tax=Bacillus sp. 1P06AnD TaxID=3132208 RepID=UPI0039A26240
MAINSGIFDSVNFDRVYLAKHYAAYFATFIGNGVFPNPSTGFQVTAGTGMNVVLKPGKAWINGYYIFNDADYNLSLDVADGVLNRIDRIVLQLNFLNRNIVPVIKKGTPGSSPIAPVLKRDADVYEIALADVYVAKGVLSITQANITDNRLNKELCGIVHGTVDQVDTTEIFNQYLAWFNQTKTQNTADLENYKAQQKVAFESWFDGIKGILNGDIAANLAAKIQTLQAAFNVHKEDYATLKTDYGQHKTDTNLHLTNGLLKIKNTDSQKSFLFKMDNNGPYLEEV